MAKIIVNDLLIQYERSGTGSGILFLHGWGQSGATFREMTRQLCKDYEVVSVDLPGFGGSQLPNSEWGVGEYVAFISNFIGKIAFTPSAIVGHSFGGRIVLKGVGEGVLTPEKIVLVGSAGIKPQKTTQQKSIERISRIAKSIPGISRVRAKLQDKFASEDYLNAGEMKHIFINTISEDLQPYAQKITQPTLLIWGENDDQTPIEDAKKLHELIRNSDLKVFPGVGHFVYQENSLEVIGEIKDFIK